MNGQMTTSQLKNRTAIFITILISGIACSMLSTALTTALPQIMIDFNINSSTGQWLTSIYSLSMGIVTLATPFLLKRVRTKNLYLISLALFLAGLLLCGATGSYAVMMTGRILQAVGNGIMVAQGQVMILTIYEKNKRGSVMGIYGLVTGVSPIIAPTIAGIIVDFMGWRMIFYLVAVVVAVSIVLTAIFFENVLDHVRERFDFLSLAFCSVGISGLLLGTGNVGTYGIMSFMVWGPFLIGIITVSLFVHRQLNMEQPFMELRVLGVPRFRMAVISSMLLYATVIASSVLLPLYIQSVRGYSATYSGFLTMPGALVSALVSPISGKLYDKYGMNKLFLGGAALLAISNLGTVFLGDGMTMITLSLLNVVRCVGVGCLLMPFVTWGMSGLEEKFTSHGTALITSLRTVAGAFGSAIFVAVVNVTASYTNQTVGMRGAFIGLTIVSSIEIIIAVYAAKRRV